MMEQIKNKDLIVTGGRSILAPEVDNKEGCGFKVRLMLSRLTSGHLESYSSSCFTMTAATVFLTTTKGSTVTLS